MPGARQHFTADLRVPQQLHNPTLIWRESNDLPDDRAHELGFGGLNALALAGTHGLFDWGGGVAVVEAATEVYRTDITTGQRWSGLRSATMKTVCTHCCEPWLTLILRATFGGRRDLRCAVYSVCHA